MDSLFTVFLIAVGLAMDAFAVSVSSGVTIRNCHTRDALRIALFFGGFQALMPVAGWLAGLGLRGYIASMDHWVAFGLLAFIGGKMIYESTVIGRASGQCGPLSLYVLIGLSVATSIDALAVGLTFAFLDVQIITPVIIIGAVTFVLSYMGVFLGGRIGRGVGKKVEAAGGLVLIAIGVKILVEHLYLGS
jgi:putative Mn2+ efflux pump MntP